MKRGVRIALRSKVNDSLITGLRIVDSILPVGRGQRQLILGDRYTGKTSIYLYIILHCNYLSLLGSIEGLGTKRIFGIHIGINQNPSKSSKLISFVFLFNWYCLFLSSHSSSSSLPSFTLPLIGISIAERLRDRGFDTIITFDDSSKHSKSYRQISSILAKIPSRDASPSDISNIHASISERCGKLKLCYFNGSITASPIIETIANDITEYTATNIIPITDRQSYTNKKLFLDSCRPSIDSSLPAPRIGSNAQCKLIKIISVGSKNEPTNYRIMELSSNSFDFFNILSLNQIFFQDHLYISSINFTIIIIILYRNGIFFNKLKQIASIIGILKTLGIKCFQSLFNRLKDNLMHPVFEGPFVECSVLILASKIGKLLFLFASDYFYFHHIIPPIKSSYSLLLYYYLLVSLLLFLFNFSLLITVY